MGLFRAHQAVEKALKGLHLSLGQQVWGHGLGRLFRDLPEGLQQNLSAAVPDPVERLRILDALSIPTRSPDRLPDGAPADHFGHLQSGDALSHRGSPSERYRQWPFEQLPLSCDALVLTPAEWQALIASGPTGPARRAMALALGRDFRWLWSRGGDDDSVARLTGGHPSTDTCPLG